MSRIIKNPNRMYERDIKKMILHYLHFRGIYSWNNRNVGLYDPRSGKFIPAVMKGIPDILGYFGSKWKNLAGHFLCIEVKAKGGRVSPQQHHFIDEAKANHCITIIAYSVDDVEKVLDELEKNG